MNEGFVLLLFSDHTWFYAMKDQVDNFIHHHKWRDNDVPKNVIIINEPQKTSIVSLDD